MMRIFVILDKLNRKFLNFVSYIASYGKAIAGGYKTNALAPLIWFNVFLIPVFTTGAILINITAIKYVLIISIIISVLFTFVMYVVLFIKDPKLLQSEGYRIEDKKLDIIAQKGGDILVNPVNLSTREIGTEINKLTNE